MHTYAGLFDPWEYGGEGLTRFLTHPRLWWPGEAQLLLLLLPAEFKLLLLLVLPGEAQLLLPAVGQSSLQVLPPSTVRLHLGMDYSLLRCAMYRNLQVNGARCG